MAQKREDFIKQNLSIPDYFRLVIFNEMADYYDGSNTDFDLSVVVRCPLHEESTGSFRFYRETDSFSCWGCGKGGDVIHLHRHYMLINYNISIGHEEAVTYLIRLINDNEVKYDNTKEENKIEKINNDADIMRFNIEVNRYITYGKSSLNNRQKYLLMSILYNYKDMVNSQVITVKEAIKELKEHWRCIKDGKSSS